MKDLKVIQFYLSDLSDNDFYFEGCDDTFTEEKLTKIFQDIRKQEWFKEGNKTEGTITFTGKNEIFVDWEVMIMGEDWDTDATSEPYQEILKQYLIDVDIENYKMD